MSDDIRPIGKENHFLYNVPKVDGAKVRDDKLNCPHCLTVNGKIVPDHVSQSYSQNTKQIYEGEAKTPPFGFAKCENCNNYTMWQRTKEGAASAVNQNEIAKNIPQEIQKTFNEAINLRDKQPDKAAELLLYSIKSLNVHLCGHEKCNFDQMITTFEHAIPTHEHARLLYPIKDILNNIIFHQNSSGDKQKLLNDLISLYNFIALTNNPKGKPKKKIDI